MKKILIVDDEPNIVMSFEYTFKKKIILKYLLLVTDKKAFDILKNQLPDVIILDVMMPMVDGFATNKKDERLQCKVIFYRQ
jgi:DNA-binding response OmpR family regulator